MSAVHMFDTYNTPNYEEELRNREVPLNAVNVLAAFKRNGEIKPFQNPNGWFYQDMWRAMAQPFISWQSSRS